ncbi:uncharacterized protein LOC106881480 isoform X2 [Octopus bimaculoides]|uniref:uncharacterized protein LOC106881480 isoform X2 n=1 Tax=Octopus bimaculoides TaxID=37653 RepID=UPI0022E59592|nr:uncharacterized protein LOC106881480 isoform X2 [Octopus bimaculoides]
MKYKTRAHAWENFFMSGGACSDDGDFGKKLAYSHSVMMDAMDKVWDEGYIHRLLLFPIFHFKQSEKKKFRKATACFLKVFDNPFAIPKGKGFKRSEQLFRRKRALPALGKAALKVVSRLFSEFLGDIATDALSSFLGIGDDTDSSASQVQDINKWKDMKITNDKVTVVLVRDQRFLRSFKIVIEDFQQHVLKCLDKDKKMTADEHKFCNIKSQSFDEDDLEKKPNDGAIPKKSPMLAFMAIAICTLLLN